MKNKLVQVLADYIITKEGIIYDTNGKQIETFINACGYVSAVLNGYIFTVSYLVGKLYVDNPNGAICIAYKDGDYTNINADNLVWYYEGEEDDEEEEIEDKPKEKKKPFKKGCVMEFDTDGNLINEYKNTVDVANKNNLSPQAVVNCCGKLTYCRITNSFFMYKIEYDEKRLTEAVNNYKQRMKRGRIFKGKKIYKVDYNTTEIIQEYCSTKEIAKDLNVSTTKINSILKGESAQLKEAFIIRECDYNEYTVKSKIDIALERMKKARKPRKPQKPTKQILKLNDNGEIIKVYNSLKEASSDLDLSVAYICKICNGDAPQRKEYNLIYKK